MTLLDGEITLARQFACGNYPKPQGKVMGRLFSLMRDFILIRPESRLAG